MSWVENWYYFIYEPSVYRFYLDVYLSEAVVFVVRNIKKRGGKM